MRIGRISEGENTVRINLEVHCSMCGKQVPGGLLAGEAYSGTDEFKEELDVFLKNHLCGICRDKKRTGRV